MAEQNKNSNRNKASKKMRIIELASFVKRDLNFRIDGLTNHIDRLGIAWRESNNRHLCHIMKVSKMIDFQVETFEELKQLISRIKPANNEISIQEKRKRCFDYTNQLEKEIRACGLYDVLFKSNNSVDEDQQLLNFIQSQWPYRYVNDRIREWKKLVCYCMENGEIKQGTWAELYILSVAKEQGISGEVIKRLRDLMNEAYQWNCKYTAAETRYKICNCLLFEMQSSDESKELKRDLRQDLRGESDAYSPPDDLPDDYFLIKSEIIKSLDEFIKIMQLCIDNKVYLCLDMVKFRKTIIKRLIGKKKFFEMLENATSEQIEKILNIDAKMDEICKSVYGIAGCTSTFRDFLYSSHNSKAVERIMDCAVTRGSFLDVELYTFCENHLQISVETFERWISNSHGWHLADHLLKGLQLCSDDIKTNNKKIDLGHIFSDLSLFSKICKRIHSDLNLRNEDFYSNEMKDFFNLVFENIDKIKLDDKQTICFLFGTFGKIDNTSKFKIENFMDVLCYYTNGPGAKTYPSNKLTKIAIVINAILKEQNLRYKDQSIQKIFETKCKEIGINISGTQNDIFFINQTLYVVDKDTGITQFRDVFVFCEYLYQNINTAKGRKYAGLLGKYICEKNNFSIYDYVKYRIVDDHYFYIICFLLHILQNHNDAKLKIENMYVNTIESKFRWFCFKLYQFFCFPFVSHVNVDISQFCSTITFNDNKNLVVKSPNEIRGISAVPESEIKTGSINQLSIGGY